MRTTAPWNNTRIVHSDIVAEGRRLKNEPGSGTTIMGSGRIVAQLTEARLIDEYHLVQIPIVLGAGRPMCEGLKEKLPLEFITSRSFPGGRVLFSCGYSAAGRGRGGAASGQAEIHQTRRQTRIYKEGSWPSRVRKRKANPPNLPIRKILSS